MSNQNQSPSQPPDVPESKPSAANSIDPVNSPPALPPTPKPEPAAESPTHLPPRSKTLLVEPIARTCPKCGHVNRPGILVCEKCGTLLIEDEKVGGTKRLGGEHAESDTVKTGVLTDTAEMAGLAVSTAGSAQFTENMVLRLEIEGAPTPILLQPKGESSIGRRDPATGTMPDIDLSAYAGYRLGVSRKHALIRLTDERLELIDLGSSNGTSVNGARLAPHQPHALRDGDEVLLGKMILRVLFQVRSRRK
jgi:hypothetical protein